MRYSEIAETERVAPASFTIRPEHWASVFKERPLAPVKVGIRLLGDADITYAQAIAKEIVENRPGDASRAHVIAAVATCICNPGDSSLAHEMFQAPEEDVPQKLRHETIQAIFDELERATIATSPVYPEADDEEAIGLAESIVVGALQKLDAADSARASRVRRYIHFILEELDRQ